MTDTEDPYDRGSEDEHYIEQGREYGRKEARKSVAS